MAFASSLVFSSSSSFIGVLFFIVIRNKPFRFEVVFVVVVIVVVVVGGGGGSGGGGGGGSV